MAKWAIFNGQGRVFKLASNDSIKDSFIEKAGEGSVAKEINDSQWNDIASNTKIVSLVNNSVQIEEPSMTRPTGFTAEQVAAISKTNFEYIIKDQKTIIQEYLDLNPGDSEWINYLNNLNSIDVSTVTFPIDSFQQWFNSQSGFSTKNILELP